MRGSVLLKRGDLKILRVGDRALAILDRYEAKDLSMRVLLRGSYLIQSAFVIFCWIEWHYDRRKEIGQLQGRCVYRMYGIGVEKSAPETSPAPTKLVNSLS